MRRFVSEQEHNKNTLDAGLEIIDIALKIDSLISKACTYLNIKFLIYVKRGSIYCLIQ